MATRPARVTIRSAPYNRSAAATVGGQPSAASLVRGRPAIDPDSTIEERRQEIYAAREQDRRYDDYDELVNFYLTGKRG